MNKGLFRKGLVFGIIMLLICVALSPVVTAVDNDTRDGEPVENSDSEASDDYEEIITLIYAIGRITTVKRLLLFLREVKISPHLPFGGGGIKLFGLRRSNGGVEKYREYGNRGFVNVSRFRGFSLPGEKGDFIIGIAFGNIEYNLSTFP